MEQQPDLYWIKLHEGDVSFVPAEHLEDEKWMPLPHRYVVPFGIPDKYVFLVGPKIPQSISEDLEDIYNIRFPTRGV